MYLMMSSVYLTSFLSDSERINCHGRDDFCRPPVWIPVGVSDDDIDKNDYRRRPVDYITGGFDDSINYDRLVRPFQHQ